MKSFKVASACVILAVVMTLSMACTVFAQKESGMARGERFIIKGFDADCGS